MSSSSPSATPQPSPSVPSPAPHVADPVMDALTPSPRSPHLERLPGLDGLRAIAVVAVLLYHLGALQGGFLGVDVFFVISGFLITSLLLAEWERRGRIDVPHFWLRRARRLLPALFLLLGAVLLFAVVAVPGEVAGLRADVTAAFFYVTNWFLIFGHQSYFAAIGRPSPFRHLWSLAVEEQFYLLWPLALSLALPVLRRRWTLVAVIVVAALSAGWMAILFQPYTDPSRVYYGTDTRLSGLLIGAALAFVWKPRRQHEVPKGWATLANYRRPTRSRLPDVVGLVALVVVFGFFALFDDYSPFLYLGGFSVLALATAALIAAVIHPDSLLGSVVLDSPPLRYLGERSYSIYLWHWPVYMFTRPQLDVALDGPANLALRLGLTLLFAELSYRFVETPIRRGALGRLWAGWRTTPAPRRRATYAWMVPASSALVVVVALVGVRVAEAVPGPVPSYDTGSIDQVVSPTSAPTLVAASTPRSSGTPRATVSGVTTGPDTGHQAPGEPSSLPTPAADPLRVGPVLAIGDSVMLGAAHEMGRQIENLEVTAAVGRFWPDGVKIAGTRAKAGTLPSIVVIDLGNNERIFDRDVDALMAPLSKAKLVVFVNLRVPREWEQRDNQTLTAAIGRFPNTVLVDWHDVTAGHPELFYEDGTHLRPQGARVYAALVAEAISQGLAEGR